MKLRNIKASFYFAQQIIPPEHFSTRKYNFQVQNFSFSIYKHASRLLNVTGVKTLKELKVCRKMMEEHFQKEIIRVRIDNTFFVKKNDLRINLAKLYYHLNVYYKVIYVPSYNQELFCGMHLKPTEKAYPTVILFSTGTYIMMGGTSFKTIINAEKFVNRIIKRHS